MDTTFSVLEPVTLPPKRPFDEVPYQLDFVDVFPVGDTIASVDLVTVFDDKDDPDSPTDLPAMHVASAGFSGTIAEQLTAGGTTGNYYQLRFRVTTTLGYKFERSGRFLVQQR